MLITDHYGNICKTEEMGPGNAAYVVLPGCPVPPGDLLKSVMDRHVEGLGHDWRQNAPIAQSVHVGPHLVWLVTHPDPRTGARLTVAMSEAELRERQG